MGGSPWYRAGLAFDCTRCGACCTGAPGYVWVDDAEIRSLALRLGLDERTFRRRYTRSVAGRGISLVEKDGGACAFYDQTAGCTVYQDRPRQCRTWPFWRSVVADRQHWESAALTCPGMGKGTVRDARAIAETAASDGIP